MYCVGVCVRVRRLFVGFWNAAPLLSGLAKQAFMGLAADIKRKWKRLTRHHAFHFMSHLTPECFHGTEVIR